MNPSFLKLYIFFNLFVDNNLIEAEFYQKKLENIIIKDNFKEVSSINTLTILRKNACATVVSFLNSIGYFKIYSNSTPAIFGYTFSEF